MKITTKILSIPPYLSTTWKNITSLHVREEKGALTLIVLLQNRAQVEIPALDKTTIHEIFEAHAKSIEEQTPKLPFEEPFSFSLPFNKEENPIQLWGPSMQHNPEQANSPPLPPEILKKITMIATAFGLEGAFALLKPEPHCNCTYCQIGRSLKGEEEVESIEEVTEEDLRFRNWEIKQTGDKLYSVTNPLDTNEQYTVFLGEPIGCNCGSKSCEHIRAVLNS